MGTMIRDPRVRQTLNQISDNFESAADTAKAGCFTFIKSYLEPCLNSTASHCPQPQNVCPCFYYESSRERRRRRGRPEFAFEFYNSDYDDDDAPEDPLRWGTDELDRLLAGSAAANRRKPARNEGMYYTRGGQRHTRKEPRRKSAVLPHDGGPDPTIIPNTSALGFLSYFPWVRQRQALRYKPSAADLQDHPGGYGGVGGEFREDAEGHEETDALLGVNGDSSDRRNRSKSPAVGQGASSRSESKRGRNRSGTTSSGDTTDTFRSRADLFPSEDEDDAVPLDDEFELPFDAAEITSPVSGKNNKKKGLRRSRTGNSSSGLSGHHSLGSPARTGGRKTPLSEQFGLEDDIDDDANEVDLEDPSFISVATDEELRREEEEARREEEHAIEMRREAVRGLASVKGLDVEEGPSSPLLDAGGRARPMFQSVVSPVLIPESIHDSDDDGASSLIPLSLHSKESMQELVERPAAVTITPDEDVEDVHEHEHAHVVSVKHHPNRGLHDDEVKKHELISPPGVTGGHTVIQ